MTDIPTLEKNILSIVLPSVVEAENFSDHPHRWYGVGRVIGCVFSGGCQRLYWEIWSGCHSGGVGYAHGMNVKFFSRVQMGFL
jgi:hypothetical protein